METESPTLNAIARYLSPNDVCLDVEVANKTRLFDFVGRHMEREHGLPQDWVVVSLSRREQAGSTGLGQGIAIPHARVNGLDRILVLYARLKSSVDFDAPDGRPVSDVLVLLVPNPAADEHLRILAEATQMFSDRRFRKRLHASSNRQEVVQLFACWPEAK
ncbi:MAG TPA: PTS sugar transporter subunit IIA [Burkholderiales bacterium]|jgi:PTS system nitrogen regulatory IIA component